MERVIASPASSEAFARLAVSRTFHGNGARLCEALTKPEWLGRIVEPPPDRPDMIRVETDLALTLRSDSSPLVFRKAALVDLAVGPPTEHGCTGEISWRASSFSPLFPVFAGQLSVGRSRLQLSGVYTPPGGQLGLMIDRAMVHRFADRTGRWFLDRLVAGLEELDVKARAPGS
jgi:hypothetical protein